MNINITRLRTVIAMLVACFSVAAATGLLAAASSAAPIAPGGGGGGTTSSQSKCDNLWSLFESDVNAADAADKAGDTAGRDSALADAKNDVKYAQSAGCDWAFMVPTTTPIKAIGPTSPFRP